MATGIFATTLVQFQALGYLPFNHLLKQMGLDSDQAMKFFIGHAAVDLQGRGRTAGGRRAFVWFAPAGLFIDERANGLGLMGDAGCGAWQLPFIARAGHHHEYCDCLRQHHFGRAPGGSRTEIRRQRAVKFAARVCAKSRRRAGHADRRAVPSLALGWTALGNTTASLLFFGAWFC